MWPGQCTWLALSGPADFSSLEIFPLNSASPGWPSASRLHRQTAMGTPSVKRQLSLPNVLSFLKLILHPQIRQICHTLKSLRLVILSPWIFWSLDPLPIRLLKCGFCEMANSNITLRGLLQESWELFSYCDLFVTTSNHQIIVRLVGITRPSEQGEQLIISFQRLRHVGIKHIFEKQRANCYRSFVSTESVGTSREGDMLRLIS